MTIILDLAELAFFSFATVCTLENHHRGIPGDSRRRTREGGA
jgi:hypothetical protein